MKVQNDTLLLTNQEKVIFFALLDVSAAFDTINRQF